jgi:hypothetical protein
MKKFIGVFAALLAGAALYAGSVDITNPSEIKDATKYNKLVRVYNADTVAHENGDVVVWAYDATYGVAITSTTSDSNKLFAGVVYPNTIAAYGVGTIMVEGYHTAVAVEDATAIGDCLGTSATAESAGVTTTAGACGAIALEVTTTSTTVKAFIRAQ